MLLPIKAAVVAVAIMAIAILPGSSLGALPAVPASDAIRQEITLYGDATGGWRLTSANLTPPGPNVTVYLGYPVTLTLIGLDSTKHTWFIDYNANNLTDTSEPDSGDFIGPEPFKFTFIPDRAGNWTYKCSYHQLTMRGTIHVVPHKEVTLYGDGAMGWGTANNTTSITSPGPRFVLLLGTNVTFSLYSHDGDRHNFFIDYNGDKFPSAGEPKTADVNASGPLTQILYLDRAGNFTYYCQYHSNVMFGNIVILGPVTATGGFPIPLISGLMLLTLGGVLVFAAVYHVRAVRAAKRQR